LESVSSALTRPTTITVTEKTRRLLESIKATGESFDDLLQDLLEETVFDDEFYREIEKRWQTEKRVPGRRVLRKAGLVGPRTTTSS
jgi:predicted CopG family antitoxin